MGNFARLAPEPLISMMYAAAQDPAELTQALSALAARFRSHIGGLRVCDSGHAAYRYVNTVGMAPREWEDFDATCRDCNLWRQRGYADLLASGVGHSDTILPVQDLLKTRFYNEHLRHVGIGHGMGMCLWADSPGQMAAISLNRSRRAGAFTADELAFAQCLLPHFRSAYAIMRRLSWSEMLATSLAASIDGLRTGVMLVDRDGHCLYRNALADIALGDHRSCWLSASEILRLADSQAQKHFLESIRLAAAGALPAPQRIYLRDSEDRLAWVLVVSMVRGELASLCAPRFACATIFLHAVTDETRDTQPLLREAFGLTPAEARLAAALLNGASTAECAERLAISMPTVRTQLRRLFEKTQTQRQAQLVSALDAVLRSV